MRFIFFTIALVGWLLPAQAQISDFEADLTFTCMGTVQFQDLSTNSPSNWLWQFGDGGLSTQQNPTYTYANSGTYTVTLQVTHAQGVDTVVKTSYVTVEKPRVTTANNAEACPNTSAQLSATNGTGTLRWYDGSNTLVHTGATFNTPPLTTTTSYFVEDVVTTNSQQYAGPTDGASVGGGGYHGSGFTGGVNFTTTGALEVVSVWVDADGNGPRTIYLWDGHINDGGGNFNNAVLAQTTVNIPDGQSRVQLNFQVPAAGDYCLGGDQMDLFRNNGSAVYPYSLAGVVDLVSSTTSSVGFYYYFYNWELNVPSECVSSRETVTATVVTPNFSSVVSGGTASFTDNSTGATSWHWDFGDGNSSTQQNPVHTYTNNNGPHTVTLTVNGGLCSFSDTVSVSVGIEQLANDMTLAIFPNPARQITTLSFNQALPQDLNIELIGIDGRVWQQAIMLTGTSSMDLDLSALAPAVYMVRLSTSEMVEVRKLVVGR